MRGFLIFVLCTLALAVSSQAATLTESDVNGGFSNDFRNPTVVGPGIDLITGGLSTGGGGSVADEFDFLQFTNLQPGAQTVSFTFSLAVPSGFTGFIGAGGTVRVKTDPFEFSAFEGTAQQFQLSFNSFNPAGSTPTQTLSFDLGSSFAGPELFVNVRTTNATQPFSFGVAVPGNAIAPVPLPATGWLMMFGLAAAFGMRRVGTQSAKHLVPAKFMPSLGSSSAS